MFGIMLKYFFTIKWWMKRANMVNGVKEKKDKNNVKIVPAISFMQSLTFEASSSMQLPLCFPNAFYILFSCSRELSSMCISVPKFSWVSFFFYFLSLLVINRVIKEVTVLS